jgi:putative ABC transport system substrate-binding protein
MRRREFIALASGAVATWPITALAQQRTGKIARIGFLGASTELAWASRLSALRAGLRALGYEEGRNIAIEFRWAEGRYDRLPELAAELVRLNVDIIVTHAHAPTLAAKAATQAIPIPVVMTNVGDAVANGIVASLSRPGGNITGDTFFLPELAAKRLELLRNTLPHIHRVAALINPTNPGMAPSLRAMEAAAAALQLELRRFDSHSPAELEGVFAAMAAEHSQALTVTEDVTIIAGAKRIAELAASYRLPTIGFIEFAQAGGLVGYGVDFLALYRRAAVFVDKILKGAKPADIPVERPTKFDLVINLATAKALGVAIPEALLAQADELID